MEMVCRFQGVVKAEVNEAKDITKRKNILLCFWVLKHYSNILPIDSGG